MSKSNHETVVISADITDKVTLSLMDHLCKSVIPDLPNTPQQYEIVVAALLGIASNIMELRGMAVFKHSNYIMALDPSVFTEEDSEDEEEVLDTVSLAKRVFH